MRMNFCIGAGTIFFEASGFENSKKYGVYLTYHVWDYSDEDNIIELPQFSKTVYFDADGDIDDVYYWFDYGTPYDVDDSEDTVLRRGHSYVFSFVGGLDLDFDDEAETRYPTSPLKILKSKTGVLSQNIKYFYSTVQFYF